jgi:hypothetical protein
MIVLNRRDNNMSELRNRFIEVLKVCEVFTIDNGVCLAGFEVEDEAGDEIDLNCALHTSGAVIRVTWLMDQNDNELTTLILPLDNFDREGACLDDQGVFHVMDDNQQDTCIACFTLNPCMLGEPINA